MMKILSPIVILSFLFFVWLGQPAAAASEPIVIPAAAFTDSDFFFPSSYDYIRETGCLGCIPTGAKREAVRGKVIYDFVVKEAGWYTLGFDPAKGSSQAWYRFQLDSAEPFFLHNNSASYFIGSGEHTLTVEANFWIGFRNVKSFVFTPSNGTVVQSVRVEKDYSNVIRQGELVEFNIHYAKQVAGKRIVIEAQHVNTKKKYSRTLLLPKSKEDGSVKGGIQLDNPGGYQITFYSGKLRDAVHKKFNIYVVGGIEKPTSLVKGSLVAEIDCSSVRPRYYGGGLPMWKKTNLGVYIESGGKGFRNSKNQNEKDVSWFAYKIRVPEQNVPYLIEVDYPDDTLRTFGVSVCENNGLFATSTGVETGGEFKLSNSIQTVSLIRWPTESDLRLVIMNAHDGMKAAISGIRMYRLREEGLSFRKQIATRQYAEWYEENLTFFSLVGMKKNLNDAGIEEACSRWGQLLATYGLNTMIMPVNAYGARMYPTDYEVDANPGERDIVKQLLLMAVKWKMKFIAEFHPKASMLLKWHPIPPEKNLFAMRDGKKYVKRSPFVPRYNMLYPENQQWLIGLVGDFVDRYKDFPSLTGVSLRFMEWQNSGLYNFHNLDWGYDDYTISVFQSESGVKLPSGIGGKNQFIDRHKWIQENAAQKWYDWRGRRVADLVKRIRDRIKQVRPDIVLYLHETAMETRPEGGRRIPRYGRGLEMKYLSDIDGVVVVNGRHRHGRKKSDWHVWPKEYLWQLIRDEMIQPEKLSALSGLEFGHFIFSHEYLEANKKVVPAAEVGFDMSTPKWMWCVSVEPAGRNALERYAMAMAETDAVFLGDGGNNYSFGPRLVISEFLPEYYSLPKVPFKIIPSATDSVVVREHAEEDRYMFYIVNRDNFPSEIRLSFSETGGLKSLSTGKLLMEKGTEINLTVKPFELRTFETTIPTMRIRVTETHIPKEVMKQRRKMVDELRSIASKLNESSFESKVVNATLKDAQQASSDGKWWKVRALLERAELVRVYEGVGCYPNGLRFGGVHQ